MSTHLEEIAAKREIERGGEAEPVEIERVARAASGRAASFLPSDHWIVAACAAPALSRVRMPQAAPPSLSAVSSNGIFRGSYAVLLGRVAQPYRGEAPMSIYGTPRCSALTSVVAVVLAPRSRLAPPADSCV